MKGLFLFSIFVITYGSLFPFEFQYVDLQTEGMEVLFSTPFFGGKLADVLGNIVLFIPFGFAGTELISKSKNKKQYYLYLYIFGIFLAFALQVIQIYLPEREPALYDAVWNYFGIFLGGFLARFMNRKYPDLLAAEDRMALLALLFSWIVFLLVPFIFSFDILLLQKNIQIHLTISEHRLANVVLYLAIWVTYAKLFEELKPNSKLISYTLEFTLVVALTAKMFVYRDLIEPELMSGGLLAVILLRSGILNKVDPYKFAAFIIVPVMFYNSLYPFEFYNNPFKEFAWIPFSELFAGDKLSTLRILFYKTFMYGSIVWTMYKSFPNSNWVTYFCIIYAAVIEYLQHQTLMRVGGLTEPLLVVFLCTFIHQQSEKFSLYENTDRSNI